MIYDKIIFLPYEINTVKKHETAGDKSSMTRVQAREAIINIIADIAPDEDLTNLNDDELLRDQIELDSMDFLDIVMELRKQYKIEVPEDDYPNLATLEGCVEYLEPKLRDF